MLRVSKLDHIVLNVRDIDRSLDFYCGVLGLPAERVEEFQAGKIGFPSVRINEATLIDLFPLKGEQAARSENLNHFCLVWEDDDVQTVIDELKTHGIEIERPPSHAWGALGRGTSIRVRDPDGNLVELRVYNPAEVGE
jgi:glyoxylase I family protein